MKPTQSDNRNLRQILKNLSQGIRNRKDPVSWRTLIVDLREVLGSLDPERKPATAKNSQILKVVEQLVRKTYLEPLTSEILYALDSGSGLKVDQSSLDFLCFNGRHLPETLLWSLADEISSRGQSVAVINPVGHYNDRETRIVGPSQFFREVKHLVILASTQSQQGGSFEVLAKVIRLVRNPQLAGRVKKVEIVIPMFGGSRGHRLGQDESAGYEILEAIFNAQILALPTLDISQKLANETKIRVPKIRFFSVDVHNEEYPAKTFTEAGFPFVSISPARIFAQAISQYLVSLKIVNQPIKLVACDQGARQRTETLATSMLEILAGFAPNKYLDLIYLDKIRPKTGQVKEAWVDRVVRWQMAAGRKINLQKRATSGENGPAKGGVTIFNDDMFDTCGTATKDVNLIREIYPDEEKIFFAATHAVFSKGIQALAKIEADHFFITNTLRPNGLLAREDVTIVDASPAILEAILT